VPNLVGVFRNLPNIIRNNARHELDFASVNVKSVEDADVDAYGSPQRDLEFIQAVVAYHQRLLHLCQDINEIFGVSLLCNFVSSSFIICFVGFQMTIGGKIDNLVMLVLFLFCAMVQVFMIATHAQRLIDAVSSILVSILNACLI